MTYRLVVFDFDGTLADTLPWVRSVFNDTARKFRFREVTGDQIEMLRGRPNREIVRYLGVPAWKLPLIAAHMRKIAARDVGQMRLFPGAEDMLRRLHGAGRMLAVVSSNSEANVRRVLGPAAAVVPFYGCGASVFGKASKFRSVLKKSGVPAPQAIAIGDEERDIEAARRAGLAVGAVCWGSATPELLTACRPDELFHRMDEIAARLAA
jgi:phosphoglycolate phosphatase